MKAKEWAAKLTESPDSRDETLKAFIAEIGAVAGQRGGSAQAVEGAVREQRVKWQAVCREDPALAGRTFESLLEAYGPEYKQAAETARAQAARGNPDDRQGSGYGRRFGRKPGRGRPA